MKSSIYDPGIPCMYHWDQKIIKHKIYYGTFETKIWTGEYSGISSEKARVKKKLKKKMN